MLLSLLLKGVEDVSAQRQDLIRALSESINFVTSLIQLFDVRRSLTEAINVRRVTYIALVFVPLSWAASIFSMAGNYSPGGSRLWVYWVVALPLLIMVFILSNTLPVQVRHRIRVFMFKVTSLICCMHFISASKRFCTSHLFNRRTIWSWKKET